MIRESICSGIVLSGTELPKTIGAEYAIIADLQKILLKAGVPNTNVITYAIAQCLLEDNWYTSNVFNQDKNASGIKWINKPYQNATRGLKSNDGGYYAHYNTYHDWAKDYVRILSIKGSAGRPIDATTAAQFGNALRANGYFTDPNYATKFNAVLKKVTAAINWFNQQSAAYKQQAQSGQNTFTYDPNNSGLVNNSGFNFDRWITKVEQQAKQHPAAAIGIGILSLLVIKKVLE